MMRSDLPDEAARPSVDEILGRLLNSDRPAAPVAAQQAAGAAPKQPERPAERKEAVPPVVKSSAQLYGDKQACPVSGWEYLDKKGNKQGPFSLEQMQTWFEMGAFKG